MCVSACERHRKVKERLNSEAREQTSNTPDEQRAVELSIARLLIYGQLARSFSYPDADLVSFFLSEEIDEYAECYRHLGIEQNDGIGKIISWLRERSDQKTAIRELEVEYTRLFITAYPRIPAPPYASIYLEDDWLVWGNTTVETLKIYREAGLKVSDDFRDVPDHIAAELEFVSYLISSQLKASEKGNNERLSKMLSIQERFLADHLLKWSISFFDIVVESTGSTFYRESSALARKFMKAEISRLSIEDSGSKNNATGGENER